MYGCVGKTGGGGMKINGPFKSHNVPDQTFDEVKTQKWLFQKSDLLGLVKLSDYKNGFVQWSDQNLFFIDEEHTEELLTKIKQTTYYSPYFQET
jgi:hypothetical protein